MSKNLEAGEAVDVDHWINGQSVGPSAGARLARQSPLDHRLVSRLALGGANEVDLAVRSAVAAWRHWGSAKPIERGRVLLALAAMIRGESDVLAGLEAAETGKGRAAAVRDIESGAAYFEFYGTLANLPSGDVIDLGVDTHVYTRREPFGVVGVITPWNLPFPQAARAVAPALAAGNTVVLKPSEFTSATAVRLAELASACGLPPGAFNVVLGLGPEVGAALVEHRSVSKLAFTGSLSVGRAIGRLAAERILPLTLELGGKSPNLVFADADLDRAAEGAVTAFTANAGQICSAGTRLLVERSVYDEFLARVVHRAEALDIREQVGPLITDHQYDQVREYLSIAGSEGLTAVTGGHAAVDPLLSAGNFILPTVYSPVGNHARLAREEVFGPVVVAIPFDGEEQAVSFANDSEFGLVAGVWTRDISRGHRVAARLQVGQVFVNTWSTNAVETPFGGQKLSGYGREKGIEALRQYQQLKTVTVAL